VKLGAGEGFFSTVVVKPPLARFEARDYRGPWRRSVSMHADLVNYHSSRCDRIRRICEDETTICPGTGNRRILFRLKRCSPSIKCWGHLWSIASLLRRSINRSELPHQNKTRAASPSRGTVIFIYRSAATRA
jgi:hypothetical protein